MAGMKVKVIQDSSVEELEIILTFAKKNDLVERILSYLDRVDQQLDCFDEEGQVFRINLTDIYYMESVDKKTFVYLADSVYQTDWRLYQLRKDHEKNGFVQINKSCLLNINVLESIRSLFNSRMEATLLNGERVIVNRSYINAIRLALGGDGK